MNRSMMLVTALLIGGCGGDGSSSNSGSSNSSNTSVSSSALNSSVMSSAQSSSSREFGLQKLNSVTTGEVYSSRLQGTNSVGTTVNGDVWITNGAEELLNGILVVPRVIDYKVYSGSGLGSNALLPTTAWVITYYVEVATGNLIAFKQKHFSSTEVLSCNSVSPYHMPATVKVGDTGIIPGFNCNGKILDGGEWAADKKGNDQLVLNIKSTVQNGVGENEKLEVRYTLDTKGNIVSITVNGLSTATAQ